MDRAKLMKLLNRDDVRGRLVRDSAFLEDSMNSAILFYFSTIERYKAFNDLILNRMGFEAKISILERIPYKKEYKSLQSLKIIRQIQRARNIVAHQHYLHDFPSGRSNVQVGDWEYLFEDWPNSYDSNFQKAKQALNRISGTNEFLGHFSLKKLRNKRANN